MKCPQKIIRIRVLMLSKVGTDVWSVTGNQIESINAVDDLSYRFNI